MEIVANLHFQYVDAAQKKCACASLGLQLLFVGWSWSPTPSTSISVHHLLQWALFHEGFRWVNNPHVFCCLLRRIVELYPIFVNNSQSCRKEYSEANAFIFQNSFCLEVFLVLRLHTWCIIIINVYFVILPSEAFFLSG